MTPRRVVVDANVFISFLVERNDKQRKAAKALIDHASDGELVAVVPQFAVFEVSYVLQSFYGIAAAEVAELLREMIALPGLHLIDECPWKTLFQYWPERISGMADAATIAIALTNRYDAVATFDQKMVKRMRALGVESYW